MNECSFEGCTKEIHARGLCSGHLWQDYNGQELRPLKVYQKSDIGLEGYRRCNYCDEVKRVSEFYKRSGKSSYYSRCKVCHNATKGAHNGV